MSLTFSYAELTTRNLGFVTEAQQRTLREAKVFVCGVGGMGGACIASLARSGIGTLGLCDCDDFEVSNLNRQVFASMKTVGEKKADATVRALLDINPELAVRNYGPDWLDSLTEICQSHPLIINGMDDLRAGIALYRKAREHGCTVVDAYSSPLPSVTVVRPGDPRPEERLRYPTQGKRLEDITDQDLAGSFMQDVVYIAANSSSLRHVDVALAGEVVRGVRKRFSFAPMVITTGNLMAYEAIEWLLRPERATSCKGYFFNPYTKRTELPASAVVAGLRSAVARRVLARMFK